MTSMMLGHYRLAEKIGQDGMYGGGVPGRGNALHREVAPKFVKEETHGLLG